MKIRLDRCLFLYASPSSGGYRRPSRRSSVPALGRRRGLRRAYVECHSMEIMRPDFRKVVDEWKKPALL